MSEQPTGYLEVPEPLAFDAQALQAIQTMMAGFDGSLPFPEYVEQYMRAWEERLRENPGATGNSPYFDLRPLQHFVLPVNDPRNRSKPMPDEETYAIRLPDGSQHQWTSEQVAAYAGEWQIDLEELQRHHYLIPARRAPSLGMLEEQSPIYPLQQDEIRKIIREELKKLLPEITAQVSAGLSRAIRMRGARKG